MKNTSYIIRISVVFLAITAAFVYGVRMLFS